MKKAKRNRWKDDGRKPILLAPLADEHAKIRIASALAGIPMAHFVLQHGLAAAEKEIAKNHK